MFSLFICLTMDGWIKLNETFRVSFKCDLDIFT